MSALVFSRRRMDESLQNRPHFRHHLFAPMSISPTWSEEDHKEERWQTNNSCWVRSFGNGSSHSLATLAGSSISTFAKPLARNSFAMSTRVLASRSKLWPRVKCFIIDSSVRPTKPGAGCSELGTKSKTKDALRAAWHRAAIFFQSDRCASGERYMN